MFQLILQFSLYYLSSGCLHIQEVKNERQFQTFQLQKWLQLLSRGGRLQEVPNIDLETFGILENWWL